MSSYEKMPDKQDLIEQEEDEQEFSLPRFSQPTGYIDYENTTHVTMETELPASNIGYKLLQKMGWTEGQGLGPSGQGRIDPIRIELKDDSLGLGKSSELNSTHINSTSKRKALEIEKQMEETTIQKIEREYKAEKKQAIAKELEQVKRAFYCELCDKQYKKISEYEQHLSSYDHHHKQRFKDMKKSTSLGGAEKEKRLMREKKREEKELKRMQDAIQKKLGNSSESSKSAAIGAMTAAAVPVATTATAATGNSGGGCTNTSDRGVWTRNTSNSSGGGWTSVSSNNATGDRGGWSNPVVQSNIPPPAVPKVNSPVSMSTNPSNNIPSTQGTISEAPPKKLAFGLKKSAGFKFGLKKK